MYKFSGTGKRDVNSDRETGVIDMKMRLLFFTLGAILLAFLTSVPVAHAFPYLEVEGSAIPDYSTLVNNGNGTSSLDVEYRFDVINSSSNSAEMIALLLVFEDDIFTDYSLNLSDGSSATIEPSDWSVYHWSFSGNTYVFATNLGYSGTPVREGETLSGKLNLTLYTEALTSVNWLDSADMTHDWSTGQVWAQPFLYGYTDYYSCGVGTCVGYGSGSTVEGSGSTAVPEPGTILLLGSALIGLGLMGRKVRSRAGRR
jgi:hypothetical protein